MKGSSVHKVENGKMLRVSLEFGQGKILEAKISGDFFMHPEESIKLLEDGLRGCGLSEEALAGRIASIVEANSVQLFGFGPKDLARAIMEAVQ